VVFGEGQAKPAVLGSCSCSECIIIGFGEAQVLRSACLDQLTSNVSVTVWFRDEDPEPVLPVTVSLYVPGGVPGLGA